jgi:hypothetical protein
MKEQTTIRVDKTLVSNLKGFMKADGYKDTLGDYVQHIVSIYKEYRYVLNQDGFMGVGDSIEFTDRHGKYSGDICTIVDIVVNTSVHGRSLQLSDGSELMVGSRPIWQSRLVKRANV